MAMKIAEARKIAALVDNEQFKGFRTEVRTAFQRLHKSAERGNKDDRRLAKFLWDEAGSWSVERI